MSTVNPSDLDPVQLPQKSPIVPNNSDGFWCKALAKDDCQEGSTICVYLSKEETLVHEVNGGMGQVLLYDVNPKRNLWFLFDIYGSVKVLEIITGFFFNLPEFALAKYLEQL